ncbi:pentatricopeptide repeat-containing protein At3g62890 [Typha latifolia]|uniref:pentatricopeptide repeat-containing protein At3g62890 n=1 Tax=Typha latifolia TaxID=4733 RepID=UPI003C2BE392
MVVGVTTVPRSTMRRAAAKLKLLSPNHPSFHLSHPTPPSSVYNTLIRAHPPSLPPLSIYNRMLLHGVRPDLYTFPFLLSSFSSSSHLPLLLSLHAHILLFGLSSLPFVATSLITSYSNCGSLLLARRVFDEIQLPDLPSRNAIIASYVKSSLLDDALQLFGQMPDRNVVTWSCMIDGFAKCGEYKEALRLFRHMGDAGVEPNHFTMSSVLSICGKMGALEQGKWAHAFIGRCGLDVNAVLGTALIDMYAKCGSIERAMKVFDDLPDRNDVMVWSAMISALAMHGLVQLCLNLFKRMMRSGIEPNDVTFLGVLCSCVHGGLVTAGEEYFDQMREDFAIEPSIKHYGCMVDLYARAGLIHKAWDLVLSMPTKPDVLIWGALLSGSQTHGDTETCAAAVEQLTELEPTNTAAYVLLSNSYAKMGRFDEVRRVRSVMDDEVGVKKVPGSTSLEVDGCLHEFFAGDQSHPATRQIYLMLDEITARIRLAEHVDVFQDIVDD